MDSRFSPRTSQKAGVRPISFILDNLGALSDPITLPIRPEDLTRTEPSRATVHQTLGREPVGWVDHFGEGMPQVTISGHTGWGYKPGLGRDGFQSFEALNELVAHRFPEFKQLAIDTGRDPADVQLLFVDMLDNFAWSVVPMQFVLRRSKSRPLLYQYNITLQAVATTPAAPVIELPFFGSIAAGQFSLGRVTSFLDQVLSTVEGLSAQALAAIDAALAPVSATVKAFVSASNTVFKIVNTASNFVGEAAGKVIGIASDLAKVGTNVFRALSTAAGLPSAVKANLSQVAGAFNEVSCIFANSLRARGSYEEYSPLYGASNCSSTTGGRPASALADKNPFMLMQPAALPVRVASAALSGVSTLARMDPVLAPLPFSEVDRHLGNIVQGIATA